MIEEAEGFAPILGKEPKVLILGSMPSQKSLAKQEYYGHPQNAFWRIMAHFFEFPNELDYREKSKHVSDKGVVIWDVIHSCIRPGSLDSDIQKDSVIVNEIENLLLQYSGIKTIIFNGGASEQTFKKHFRNWVKLNKSIHLVKLPSTSPAHASLNFDQKYCEWSNALEESLK